MIPLELQAIVDHLIKKPIGLTNSFQDGRINSSINESQVIECIKSTDFGFHIEIGKKREWFDFAIKSERRFYPVNIKVTDTTHADNLNCKLGIYYALTGVVPKFPNEISWDKYFEKLNENMQDSTDADYYFLVLNKQNTTDVFANTLKSLSILQANGNNLPFQCKWDSNRQTKERTFHESKDFLLKIFGESIKQRASIYNSFERYFEKYV